MIGVSIVLRIQPDKRLEFLSAIKSLITRMRWLPGCLGCRLVIECDASETFSLLAEWNDRVAFDRFMESRELVILQGMRLLLRDDPHAVIDDIITRAHLSFVNDRRVT
jgi:quinol monooxygenase YgiN